MVETVSFRAFLEANWGTYGYGYLRWPGVEVTDETVKLPPYISAVLRFALARFGTLELTATATQRTDVTRGNYGFVSTFDTGQPAIYVSVTALNRL